MLYGPGPFEDGTWVRFSVLLADESPALEGVGRAVASIDGGDERPDAARFDIVLDSLQLDGYGGAVYERILMMRQGGDEERGTGDFASVPDPDAEPVFDDQTQVAEGARRSAPPPEDEGWSDDGGDVGSSDFQELHSGDAEELEPRPSERPAGFHFGTPTEGRALLRPTHASAWRPSMMPVPQPRPAGEHFAFGDRGLPVPGRPPRPELDPTLRVQPAPKPAAQHAGAARSTPPRAHGPADAGAYGDDRHYDGSLSSDGDAYGDATMEGPVPDPHPDYGSNGEGHDDPGLMDETPVNAEAHDSFDDLEGEATRAVDAPRFEDTHQTELPSQAPEHTAVDINAPDEDRD
jgi:hypothetical protein